MGHQGEFSLSPAFIVIIDTDQTLMLRISITAMGFFRMHFVKNLTYKVYDWHPTYTNPSACNVTRSWLAKVDPTAIKGDPDKLVKLPYEPGNLMDPPFRVMLSLEGLVISKANWRRTQLRGGNLRLGLKCFAQHGALYSPLSLPTLFTSFTPKPHLKHSMGVTTQMFKTSSCLDSLSVFSHKSFQGLHNIVQGCATVAS